MPDVLAHLGYVVFFLAGLIAIVGLLMIFIGALICLRDLVKEEFKGSERS